MRAGLSTIQQTLTPEAASVLNHSIAEAGRRNHSQTTPLHVAATLLGSPTGYLRQACIKSHPNSSHPLQCRALELCFSVALDRLPTSQATNGAAATEPPISNALMAALKRAQAHQRRGCPEQQQQPLLAVKVELEQLIISILDDPSVSRVMREASFSSPAVKATIEHSINCSNTSNSNTTPVAGPNSVPPVAGFSNSVNNPIGLPFRPQGLSKNLYLNPRLQGGVTGGGGGGIAGGVANNSVHSGPGQSRFEEIKRVGVVLMRGKKRNPVLVGESEPQAVAKELLRRIESNELGGDQGGFFKNVQVVRLDKEFASDKAMISGKLKELGDVVEARIGNLGCGGVIIDLGDLKWLVEQPVVSGSGTGSTQVGSENGKIVVTEMAKLLARFSEGNGSGSGSGRLWLIGTATCETYLRCQVYHPTMEADWDLQAMPIATRAALPGLFPRLGTNGTSKHPVGSPSPLKSLPIINPAPLQRLSENSDQSRKPSCCPECAQKLEQELAKLAATEFESTSPEVKSEAARPTLPQWLQNAKTNDGEAKSINNSENKEQEGVRKQKVQELQKKWNETCLHSHPQFHQRSIGPERITPAPHALTGLYNPSVLLKQPLQHKLKRSLGDALQLSSNPLLSQTPEQAAASPPRSPVRTDLVLGQPKLVEPTVEKPFLESVKDFFGVLSSEPQIKVSEFSEKLLGKADADSYKKLLKGLADKVWWQHDAASAVASAMTQCKLGNGKKRGLASKGDIWLLFTGPDRVGKKKMAAALADLVCGASPIMISFGSRRDGEECNRNFRGKTALDRIAEAVRWNPFSVIMLEDIDEADMLVRGSIKRAIERGRIADSHGREISLANVTIILSVNWLPDNLKSLSKSITLDEEKLENLASTAWQLRLSLCERTAKRRANWLHEEERFTKPRKDASSGFGFDLNEAADVEDDRGDGSRNSSDLTVDSDIDHGTDKRRLSTMSLVYNEFVGHVDDSIVFNPVDFTPIVQDTKDSIVKAFSSIIGNRVSIEVQDEAVQKILGGVWLGNTGLEEWTESVLIPSFHILRARLPSTIGMLPDESTVVRLESRSGDSGSQKDGNRLPSTVVVDGV